MPDWLADLEPGAPDVVAYPHNEADIAAVLDWAGGADATVTPFGGGSSVCGGVEPKRFDHKGAVTIDLREMNKVIDRLKRIVQDNVHAIVR